MPQINRTKSEDFLVESDAATLLAKRVKLPCLRTDVTFRTAIDPKSMDDFTPTTIEACRRAGIDPKDLLPQTRSKSNSLEEPLDPQTSPSALKKKLGKSKSVVMELRRAFLESERLSALKLIDQERNILLDQGWTSNVGSSSAQRSVLKQNNNQHQLNRNGTSYSTRSRVSRTQAGTKHNSPIRGGTDIFELEKQFFRKEQRRHQTAVQKQQRSNRLLLAKLKQQGEMERRKLMPSQTEKELSAIRRHSQHLRDIKNTFQQRNKYVSDKSNKAIEEKQNKQEKKLKQILQTLEENDLKTQKMYQLQEKENREFKLKQDIRFQHHQLKYNKIIKQQKKHRKSKYKYLKKRQNLALYKAKQQTQQIVLQRKKQSESKEIKIKENIIRVREAEQRKRIHLENKINDLTKKIKNVEKQREAIRVALKKQSSSLFDRLEKVNQAKEEAIEKKWQTLEEKSRVQEMRQIYIKQQREAQRLLNHEMSKLQKKHRMLQKQRKEQREEYRRQLIEQRLKEKEEKVEAMQRAKQRMIEKHRFQTNKTRLLRQEANYQFEHLRADTINNPESMKKFVELYQRQLSC